MVVDMLMLATLKLEYGNKTVEVKLPIELKHSPDEKCFDSEENAKFTTQLIACSAAGRNCKDVYTEVLARQLVGGEFAEGWGKPLLLDHAIEAMSQMLQNNEVELDNE